MAVTVLAAWVALGAGAEWSAYIAMLGHRVCRYVASKGFHVKVDMSVCQTERVNLFSDGARLVRA
jgi:hypothetical protein